MRCEKVLMVILDGMPDRPVPELDGRTPLQEASTPALDTVAREGTTGIMDVIRPGIVPGSDTAHLSLLGYDPIKNYSGRGPFEAAGVGVECMPGDVAFRCNFATVDDKLCVIDRRAGRIKDGTSQLAKAISGLKMEGVEVIFREATEHRAVLLLRGPGLDPRVTDVDPHQEGVVVKKCVPLVPDAALTARIVNAFIERSYSILMKNPVNLERASRGLPVANMVLPRGAGVMRHLESFGSKYGLRAAGIAGVSLIRGVFRILAFDVIEVRGATGGIDTDMMAKGAEALNALGSYDFVCMNVKAPDIAGHDGDYRLKIEVIERADAMLSQILDKMEQDTLLVVLSDHSTPVSLRNHSADPVCFAIRGAGVRPDAVKSFDEIACASGALRGLRGGDLLPVVRGIIGKAEKFGA